LKYRDTVFACQDLLRQGYVALKSRQGLVMPCGKGCMIVLFAVPGPDKKVVVPVNDFWMKEITIRTSYY
jgi:threonine dehydrogenase-like Zn-dependent dehydrogenase